MRYANKQMFLLMVVSNKNPVVIGVYTRRHDAERRRRKHFLTVPYTIQEVSVGFMDAGGALSTVFLDVVHTGGDVSFPLSTN
jgi:hypothetical protein